ncbi:putative 39S ribosomal protein L45, mitochondrial [Lucilia cuprina]|uniref:Large ribosomal subunit protein mL45 n=1 Tax=Lucilia cuprina TaxID=7375 RepID=A0A0L0C3B9_LUCCU|nr:probable 39S ribosomal protein L45, mitochondrial [Lucilia cuprina]KAI8129799.1 mitochondrial, Probable 39S ribosomal protein L45 [Lucilia cuprina]KNC26835.1 putative 39S ribosomal protein L45, mitochondrial [Lucilia cuprina]
MEMLASTRNCIKFMQCLQPGMLTPGVQALVQTQQVRHRQTKHWAPKFKRLRKLKFVKMDLPDFHEKPNELPQDELKKRMKERGFYPPRPWLERPFHISCTGGIFEPYVPPEGDGKKSFISAAGAKQKFEFLEKKSKSMLAVRKIRSYEEEFDTDAFPSIAQDVYIEAHKFMAEKNKHQLREFVTERAYPEMMHNVKDKTIHWKFLKSLEPPRVVHARVTDIISKENLYAQVTVRFHTQQMLAIYDRFGRLMHGSEILAKDVLEYVVFEKHISNEYGKWRLHDKIIPDWLPPKQPALITYKLIEDAAPEQIDAGEETKQLKEGEKKLDAGSEAEQLPVSATTEKAAAKPNATAI